MTLDELLQKIGIANDKKEVAQKVFKEFLDGSYVPKARFNEVNEEKKTLQNTVKDRDTQLEKLKNSKGDVDALKAQIKQLQDTNKAEKEKNDAAMKDLKLTSAIRVAIAGSAQDVDIVSGLFDKSKLILGDDGKITGLDEQLKALKDSKSFLFKDDSCKKKPKYEPNGGSGGSTTNPFAKDTFNLTEQGKLFQENPEQARALAAEAGVTI